MGFFFLSVFFKRTNSKSETMTDWRWSRDYKHAPNTVSAANLVQLTVFPDSQDDAAGRSHMHDRGANVWSYDSLLAVC